MFLNVKYYINDKNVEHMTVEHLEIFFWELNDRTMYSYCGTHHNEHYVLNLISTINMINILRLLLFSGNQINPLDY